MIVGKFFVNVNGDDERMWLIGPIGHSELKKRDAPIDTRH